METNKIKYKYSILIPINTPDDEFSKRSEWEIDMPIGIYETNGLIYERSIEVAQQFPIQHGGAIGGEQPSPNKIG